MNLAVPSWLVPGGWRDNLAIAAGLGWAHGAELLCFSYDAQARALFSEELPELRKFAPRLALSVHLPDPLAAADEELVAATAAFSCAYVIHPPRPDEGSSWAATVADLRARYGDRFLLEYTGARAFALGESFLPGLPLCADTGRLLLDGEDPASWIASHSSRIQEIHLHAARGGRDHLALEEAESWLRRLVPSLLESRWRIVLETFSLEGVCASRAALLAAGLMPARNDEGGA